MKRLIVGLVVVLTLSLTAGVTDASINELFVAVDGGHTITRFDGDSGVFMDVFIGRYGDLRIRTMTIGPDGNIYAGVIGGGTTARRVIRYDGITGANMGVFTEFPDVFNGPKAMTFGSDGNLYVGVGTIRDASGDVSNGGVFEIDGTTGELLGEFGETNHNISGLLSPEGMVFGPDGDLYIASYGSHEILRFDGTTGDFKGVFGDASSEVIIGSFYPRDVIFGPGGMYVANQGAASGNVLLFDGLSGDYLGEFIASGAGDLTNPLDIEFGPDNNLYVADYEATGILRFDGTTGLFLGIFTEDPGNPLNQRTLDIEFRSVAPDAVIPEPTTFIVWTLLGTVAITVGWWRRRKHN